VTRGQIDEIRGVGSDSALATLRLRGLVEPSGRANGPGRPLLFKTTQKFLSHFGLEKATDMPNLPDYIEIPISEIAVQLGMDESVIGEIINTADKESTDVSQTKYGEAAGGA
jgi:segregation and condensation protein B